MKFWFKILILKGRLEGYSVELSVIITTAVVNKSGNGLALELLYDFIMWLSIFHNFQYVKSDNLNVIDSI